MSTRLTYKPRWRCSSGRRPYRNLVQLPNTFDDGSITQGGYIGSYTIPVTTLPKTADTLVEPKVITESPYIQQQNQLANITPVLTYASPNTDPVAQVQFIDADEFRAISNEGIVIPESANVVIVPVSSGQQPEIFNQIVEQKIAEPLKPIEDIVYQTVLNSESNVPDVVKEEILFTQEVIQVKQEYPEATIVQIEEAIVNNQPVPVTNIDPVLTNIPEKPEVVTAADILNNLSNGNSLFGDQKPATLVPKEALQISDEEQMYMAASAAIIGILLLL